MKKKRTSDRELEKPTDPERRELLAAIGRGTLAFTLIGVFGGRAAATETTSESSCSLPEPDYICTKEDMACEPPGDCDSGAASLSHYDGTCGPGPRPDSDEPCERQDGVA